MWGSQDSSGLVLGDAGPPQVNFAGNIPYNTLGLSWPSFGFDKTISLAVSTDLAWGRSTIKVGFEYRHHSFLHKGFGVRGAAGQLRLYTGSRPACACAGNNLSHTGSPPKGRDRRSG